MKTIRSRQNGLSLISLMIAMTIGLFLLAGLFDLWMQTRLTFSAQGSLAQLQDNERTALTLMANIVQTGGYYPLIDNYKTPTNPTPPNIPFNATNVFIGTGNFIAGQYFYGTVGGTNDALSVRFMSDGNTLDCQGQSQADRTLVTNSYQIDENGNLQCAVTTTTAAGATNTTPYQTLVTNISSLRVFYGIDPTSSAASASEYMDANAVTKNSDWLNIRSVQLQLTFKNPLASQTGQSPTLPSISRIIAVTQTTNSI